jgi:hypothetical protein
MVIAREIESYEDGSGEVKKAGMLTKPTTQNFQISLPERLLKHGGPPHSIGSIML